MIGAIFLISLTILLILIHVSAGFVNGSERYTVKTFKKANIDHRLINSEFNGRQLQSIYTGNTESQTLVCFIHGAPGAWNAFKSYLIDSDLLDRSQMISIDRFGYGGSDYGHAELDIAIQARAIKEHLEQLRFDSLVLVGHSYGGPIAAKYAVDFPEKVKHVFMLAPVINPETEKEFWFNNVLSMKLFKIILPAYVNVSVTEKLNHANSLRKISGDWSRLETPTTHWHCSDDWIAPSPGNVEFSKTNIPPELLDLNVWNGAGHLIPFNQFAKVKSKILEIIED